MTVRINLRCMLVLFTAQLFGIMPVCGIGAPTYKMLKFKWFSKRSILAYIVLGSLTFEVLTIFRVKESTILGTIGKIEQNLLLDHFTFIEFYIKIGAFTFYTITTLGHYLFFRLAIKWPRIMEVWAKEEQIFLQPPYLLKGPSLKRRIRIVCYILMFASLCKSST